MLILARQHYITTSVRLHVLRRPGVLIHRVLDVLHLDLCFLPSGLIPLCPVNVALCKLHLPSRVSYFLLMQK